MKLLPKITIRNSESLFEFFTTNSSEQLSANNALQLLEDLSHDFKGLLWAFRRTGDKAIIYHYPDEHEIEIRDEYVIAVPETKPYSLFAWLPSAIAAKFVSNADKIEVRLEIPPCDVTPCTISLSQFMRQPGII